MIPLMKNAFMNEIETRKALSDFVLSAPRLSMSEKCFDFEKAFAIKQNRKDAILFNSGGSANLALLQALKNLGRLKDGDNVGFSALTWSTNTMPIIQLGMTPVAIDCSIETLNVMKDHLEIAHKNKPLKAFFGTNVLGFAGDLDQIKDFCQINNIIFIEDNCEALGTILTNGEKTGNFGIASTFSFFVAHHMSSIEGGMICSDDEELLEMLRIVRANGWDRNLTFPQQVKWRKKYNIHNEFYAKYTFYDLGFNLRPTEITGFLGLFQLKFLEENIIKRQKNYLQLEQIVKNNPDLITLKRDHIQLLSNFAFPVICKTTNLRIHYLEQFAGAGVEIRPMIAGNIQRQPFYSKYIKENDDLPNADFLHDNGFYFGNYPELLDSDLEILSSCLTKY